MDYAFLRQKGIEYIQQLAGTTWTDHNLHDPGITILEVLCYSLTELGYRTDYGIGDILASGTENLQNNFYTAAKILPCNPLTVNDFRRLIIDCQGVRNAWFEKPIKYEKDIYFDQTTDELNYKNGPRVRLNGLYDIQLELEEDYVHQSSVDLPYRKEDLNSNIIKWEIIDDSGTHPIEVEFPYWDQVSAHWTEQYEITRMSNYKDQEVSVEYRGDDRYHYSSKIKFSDHELDIDKFEIRIKFTDANSKPDQLAGAVLREIKNTDGLIRYFHNKIITTHARVGEVRKKLNRHRNLCEDFYQFKAVRVQEIGVTASVEIAAGTDAQEVLSKIYTGLNNLFSPSIKFHSLQELLDQGLSPDQIFEGPLLDHGFIRSEDLDVLNLRDVIYTSELINIIMKIDGVQSVSDLKVSNYIYNQVINKEVGHCLKLIAPETYQAKLSFDKSDFEITLNDLPVRTTLPTFGDDMETESNALQAYMGHEDLDVPTGERTAIDAYDSLQNHFPLIYGIGEEGLPESVSDMRKNQARQLKAYLLFFEQLLANHFSQLAHITDLFSMNANVKSTYFTQPLHSVPNASELLEENYEESLQSKVESESDFSTRRNQFLEHLIARFSEDFMEYTTYAKDNISLSDLTSNKISFLQDYPELSRNRGQAIDYLSVGSLENDTKDIDLLSGFELRLSRLLGLKNEKYDLKALDRFIRVEEVSDGKWEFKLFDENNEVILISKQGFSDPEVAHESACDFIVNWMDSFIIERIHTEEDEEEEDDDGDDGKRRKPKRKKRKRSDDEDDDSRGHHERKHRADRLRDRKSDDDDDDDDDDRRRYYGRRHRWHRRRKRSKGDHKKEDDDKFEFRVTDKQKNVFAVSLKTFDSKQKRDNEINRLKELLAKVLPLVIEKEKAAETERIRVIEHILLRPKICETIGNVNVEDDLIPVSADHINDNGDLIIDPYSFRITVLLPRWLNRFMQAGDGINEFGRYAERVVAMETPAHILADIYWVEASTMARFEAKYKNWLIVNASPEPADENLRNTHFEELNDAHHQLLSELAEIRTQSS
ncbi:MAG: hypothetical protein ABJF04_21680 [Reichenbachiella sp.]|uniref:hypothetical protein n=1 Tax=Reichenbachiella sp. TaxID=2184521 RepID=UPI003265481D